MTTAKKSSGKSASAHKAAARSAAKPAAKRAARKTAAPKAAKQAAASPPKAGASKASDAIDEQLARYRSMRDFHITAEPSGSLSKGKPRPTGALPFVIQKHAASHLHYDFRLGWNGVLKSWAVAKGPSYFTGDRRLAIQVEDHPMEYGGFEGIIPQGQYGGGTVMIWDQGTWTPQLGYENVDAGLRDGSLKFVMQGKKMHGKWTLVRMAKKPGESKPSWLLIKEHDEFERRKDDPCITDEEPNSAATGRTMEQIAHQEDHVWNSKDSAAAAAGRSWYRKEARAGEPSPAPAKHAAAPLRVASKPLSADLAKLLDSLPKEQQPAFVPPQLALEAARPPGSGGWLHELKLDGYRIQARKDGSRVQMLTRKGLDWTHRVPTLARALAALPAASATLDGEVVVLNEDGTTSFADLQAAFQEGARKPLTYFSFDLLHLNGRNTRNLPLRSRKQLLASLMPEDDEMVRLSEHIETGGEVLFQSACELHAEGIVSKRAEASYCSGRSGEWLKCKCLHEQEFVIGGYTLSSDGPDRIGSLVLGYYQSGKLVYAGRTGTGFTQKARRMLKDRLDTLTVDRSPFGQLPADARRGVTFVKPQLVAQVRFATWTADNLVRQAAFLGLREDKPAAEVERETAASNPRPKSDAFRRAAAEAASAPAPTAASHRPALVPAAKTNRSKPPASNLSKPLASGVSSPPIRLTHPSKILDAESGVTKQQLADFYWAIANRMLPHIAGRPLSLVRCPEGSGKPCFFQKHVNHMLPKGIESVDVIDKKTGKPQPYITLHTAEALAGLAQMGVLEVHPWGSCNDDLEHPDRLIFDLDPDAAISWRTLCEAAAETRARLRKLGLTSFLKTTGGKGLHVVAPIAPDLPWPAIKEFAYSIVRDMERQNPALFLTKMTKAARTNKIYLDYLRNERGATAVAPYSPRARAGLPVSLPLPWKDLDLPERPVFRIADFSSWSARLKTDPWKDIFKLHPTVHIAATKPALKSD